VGPTWAASAPAHVEGTVASLICPGEDHLGHTLAETRPVTMNPSCQHVPARRRLRGIALRGSVRDAFERVVPEGWALDDAKPIVGSHWQVELVEMRDDRDIRLSVCDVILGCP
jgi:hypothetical protein